jgi:hypothetical protein
MTNPFFEITNEEIAQLDDATLRELVGLLCEAEFRRHNLDTSGVLWGGNQDAPDGGFDVVVNTSTLVSSSNYLCRKNTGFQVKKPDMPASRITPEMRPNGIVRKAIRNLIKDKGSYIIVSSGSSTTATALEKRICAMKEAVKDCDPKGRLHLDFLDSGRIATWVRNHPGLVLWVKNRLGLSYYGWRPYEVWVRVPKGGEDKYLLDDQLRMFDDSKSADQGVTPLEAISRLRNELSIPRNAIRLTGLSGVGKTRLVQALFDNSVGEDALNPSGVFYTDVAEGPSPDPQAFVEQLVALNVTAIVVLDNCPPELHRQAAQTCSRKGSKISFISVEYDVREDLPPETSVYRLGSADENLIERIVELHYPHISDIDAQKIAEFSGGNARVADVLAATIGKGETVSGFRDEDLFKRLFLQRNESSERLLLSAELLSLVYSFDGEQTDENSELSILALIAGLNAQTLFADSVTLKDRHLIQSRSKWRAMLPHAIANRLAADALRKNPKQIILDVILESKSERLIKSFSHRLSFLHDSEDAVEITSAWLSPTGWIGKHVNDLNPFGFGIFKNLAPVCPEAALEGIERASSAGTSEEFFSRKNSHHLGFVTLLRAISFEAQYFDRCCRLLIRFAIAEDEYERVNSVRGMLKPMFYVSFSGTWATANQRLNVLKELFQTNGKKEQDLGISLLEATFESWQFSFGERVDFGARSRDYGRQPVDNDEFEAWYKLFFTFAKKHALADNLLGEKIRKVVANQLRSLWGHARIYNQLESLSLELHKQSPWNEGWIAIREILYFDYRGNSDSKNESLTRLEALEKKLRPKDLVQKARTYATAKSGYNLDLIESHDSEENEEPNSYDRVNDLTREIGIDVAKDSKVLEILLPELLGSQGYRTGIFGEGLAKGSTNVEQLWQKLLIAARSLGSNLNISAMLGYLAEAKIQDSEFVETALDNLLKDPVLAEKFPLYQFAVGVNAQGLKRLHVSLKKDLAPIWMYQGLAGGRTHENLSDTQLISLARKISDKPGGLFVVVEILKMRFHVPTDQKKKTLTKNLLRFGREIMLSTLLTNNNRSDGLNDYDLADIAKKVYSVSGTRKDARKLCLRLISGKSSDNFYIFHFPKLLNTLAQHQPEVFLDVFLAEGTATSKQRRGIFLNSGFSWRENPLSRIDDQTVLKWCAKKPNVRYLRFAKEALLFHRPSKETPYEWKPLFFEILDRAPSQKEILESTTNNMRPSSWSGSLHLILEQRAVLFEGLEEHADPAIRKLAAEMAKLLQRWIDSERTWEKDTHKNRDERFE